MFSGQTNGLRVSPHRPPACRAARPIPGAWTLALLGLCAAAVRAESPNQNTGAPASLPASYAVRAQAIYPAAASGPQRIDRGVMIVRDGKIAAIGADLPIPADLPVIDLRDAVLCPGFVSAASSLAGRHSGPESVSGLFRAADAFDPYGLTYLPAISRGTTALHLDPGGHRLVSGRGAIAKLGPPGEARLLNDNADLQINLGAFDPPPVVDPPFYASSDVAIVPGQRQAPSSRLDQFLELERQISGAAAKEDQRTLLGQKFDGHTQAFRANWNAKLPLRIQVRRAADIERALAFLQKNQRPATLVALTEADRVAAELVKANLPLVVRMERGFRQPEGDLGGDPDIMEPSLTVAEALKSANPKAPLALAGIDGDPYEDLRMAAVLALRGGLSPEAALTAITRGPAEILGVADRIGSLEPGKDADFLVFSAAPLESGSQVQRVYIDGRLAYQAPGGGALVVKAGTIWVGNGDIIHDGSLLIDGGKVKAVGQRVPIPRSARVIDAGADGFVTPGFIDSRGHLGLYRDASNVGPDFPIQNVIGAATREFERVAQAGITTVLLSGYRPAPNGSRMAAIKTWGPQRDDLIARDTAGVLFTLRGKDPFVETEAFRRTLEAGKAYEEKWKKYETELAEWKKTGGAGVKPKVESDTTVDAGRPDPITGTWTYSLSGGPIPQPVTGTMTLRLSGSSIEGRLSSPEDGDEVNLTGTLEGTKVTLEIDQETPVGKPQIIADLDRDDHMAGKVAIAQFSIDFEATRTDKAAVEFKVSRRKSRTKDGRPTPPKVDESLEPLRPLLAGKIPAVIEVDTAPQIMAALKLFVDEFKLNVVLLGAADAADVADQLKQRKDSVGIVTPPGMVQRRDRAPVIPAIEAEQMGLRFGLQSDAEEGARTLPLMGLFAVQQGLGGDGALRALTVDAAKMYKLDDRLGTLEPGKDGDVLIYTGHPFDADSRLKRVIVGGNEVPNE